MRVAIAISYCGSHLKGSGVEWNFEGKPGPVPGSGYIDGGLHARMLAETVKYLWVESHRSSFMADLLICATAFQGLDIENEEERRHMWEVFRLARFITTPNNPGPLPASPTVASLAGTVWNMKMALEAAVVLKHEFLIWTAEDVLLPPGGVAQMIAGLENADYYGTVWGQKEENLNAQCFACRAELFARLFDAGKAEKGIEEYVAELVRSNGLREKLVEPWYFHTHNPHEHHQVIGQVLGVKE